MEIQFEGKTYNVRSSTDITVAEWNEAADYLELPHRSTDGPSAAYSAVAIFSPGSAAAMREWSPVQIVQFSAAVFDSLRMSVEAAAPCADAIVRFGLALIKLSETLQQPAEHE